MKLNALLYATHLNRENDVHLVLVTARLPPHPIRSGKLFLLRKDVIHFFNKFVPCWHPSPL